MAKKRRRRRSAKITFFKLLERAEFLSLRVLGCAAILIMLCGLLVICVGAPLVLLSKWDGHLPAFFGKTTPTIAEGSALESTPPTKVGLLRI